MMSNTKKSPRRKLLVISLILLGVSIFSGKTLAYLVTGTESDSSLFQLGQVSCEVCKESDEKNVTIKNTGEVPAYIRAAVVVTFAKQGTDGAVTVSSVKPEENTDYTLKFQENTKWKRGSDGFWYYTEPVAAGAQTEVLIEEFASAVRAAAPQEYKVSIEVTASAIQASGTSAVTESWTSGVTSLEGQNLVIREGSR